MRGDIHETVEELIHTLQQFPGNTLLEPGYGVGITSWPGGVRTVDIFAVEDGGA